MILPFLKFKSRKQKSGCSLTSICNERGFNVLCDTPPSDEAAPILPSECFSFSVE